MTKLIESLAVNAGHKKTYIARIERSVVHVLIFSVTRKNVNLRISGIFREIVGI